MTRLDRAMQPIRACKSPDEIAAFLSAEGCTGVRKEVTECVLAVYLHRETGCRYTVRGFEVEETFGQMHWSLNASEQDFLRNFDLHSYPKLEKDHDADDA